MLEPNFLKQCGSDVHLVKGKPFLRWGVVFPLQKINKTASSIELYIFSRIASGEE